MHESKMTPSMARVRVINPFPCNSSEEMNTITGESHEMRQYIAMLQHIRSFEATLEFDVFLTQSVPLTSDDNTDSNIRMAIGSMISSQSLSPAQFQIFQMYIKEIREEYLSMGILKCKSSTDHQMMSNVSMVIGITESRREEILRCVHLTIIYMFKEFEVLMMAHQENTANEILIDPNDDSKPRKARHPSITLNSELNVSVETASIYLETVRSLDEIVGILMNATKLWQ